MPLSSLNAHVYSLWRVIRPQVSRHLHIFLPGWIGLPLLLVFTLTSSYTGIIISKSWIIIQNRFPEYSQHVPDPYPVIGEKAYGKFGRYVCFLFIYHPLCLIIKLQTSLVRSEFLVLLVFWDVCCVLPVCLDCPYLIDPLILYGIYLQSGETKYQV